MGFLDAEREAKGTRLEQEPQTGQAMRNFSTDVATWM